MATYIAEVFGFLIILAILGRYIAPMARKAMRARQDSIRAEFAEARAAKERAEADEAQFTASVTDADAEMAEIVQSAESQAEAIITEFRDKADQEAERVTERGRQQLAAERDSLIRELRAQTGTEVVALASFIVGEALADDDRRAATVERFLADIDERSEQAAAHADEAAPAKAKVSS